MSIGLQTSDNGEPDDGYASNDSSTGSRMLASEANVEDLAPEVAPNRRLRNWILFANAVAWLAILVIARLLFF